VQGWNAWLEATSGVASCVALGRTIEDVFPGLAASRLSGAIRQALETGASSILTQSLHGSIFPLQTRAGRDLLHNVSVRPLP
jgi:hypothetical protein